MKTLLRIISLIALASFTCGCASHGSSPIGNWLSPWTMFAGHETAIGHNASECMRCLHPERFQPATLPRNPFYNGGQNWVPQPTVIYTQPGGIPQMPQPGGQYRDHLGRIHTVR